MGKTAESTGPVHTEKTIKRMNKPKKLLLLLVAALIFIGGIAVIVWAIAVGVNKPPSDRYQAVFLDNGQVFFGKLKNTQGAYLKLENAYYSKAQQLPEDATDEQKAAVANNVSLIKVGDEVYGPESSLSIRAEQVLFWQNLTPDSKVSKAIQSAQN